MNPTTITPTTPEALRTAIANAVQVDAQQLLAAVGSIAVATSEEAQASAREIQSLYDSDSRTLTLLSDRIPAGQESQAFAAALTQHLGYDTAVNLVGGDEVDKLWSSGNKTIHMAHNAPTPGESMPNAKRVTVNGYPAIQTQLTVSKGSFSFARSAIGKMPSSEEFAWLMGILEGRDVTATVFSGTNVSGNTNADQLRQAFAGLNPDYSFWIKEPQLEAVIAKFGDGKLGFTMSGMYCEQTPAEIEKLLASVQAEPSAKTTNEPMELEVTLRSKTTFGTDKETIRVWEGQNAKDVAERTAQGYGAEVVEIRNPDGSLYEEPNKADESPSPSM